MWQYGKQIDHYTAEQMKAYARHYAEMRNELDDARARQARMLEQ